MTTVLDPYVSEFETEEQEAQYTIWLRSKVQEAIGDNRPCVPHDDVMAKVDALIEKIKERQSEVVA